jgi:hypothetical protein
MQGLSVSTATRDANYLLRRFRPFLAVKAIQNNKLLRINSNVGIIVISEIMKCWLQFMMYLKSR